jgi:hypothetical protein
VVRLQAKSNDYYHSSIKPGLGNNNKFLGLKWDNITKAEMYRFLGIILRISMKDNKVLHTGVGPGHESHEIPGTKGWAWRYMSLRRFQQICAAFHPKNVSAGLGGDKCYQLWLAINHLNAASRNTFMPGGNVALDEGGVACRSRLCPVRQYNKDKPQKYRVNFFILADSSTYVILHLDVYQGRNATNVNIDSRCLNLPTTMKAVVNAVFQTNLIHKTEEGYRCISMDNRYQCPELAVFLVKCFKILSTGTCRQNRKGWRLDLTDLAATTGGKGRCESKIAFDKVNGIMLLQWRDSNVLNCVSSILDTTIEETQQQIGRNSKIFSVPRPLKAYHRFMFAVDKGDQSRMHLGGFAQKQRYKKSFFAILDCMLLNSWISWNMSVEELPRVRRNKLERFEFYEWISTSFLLYQDEEVPAAASQKKAPAVSYVQTCRLVNLKAENDTNRDCIACRRLDRRYAKSRSA